MKYQKWKYVIKNTFINRDNTATIVEVEIFSPDYDGTVVNGFPTGTLLVTKFLVPPIKDLYKYLDKAVKEYIYMQIFSNSPFGPKKTFRQVLIKKG